MLILAAALRQYVLPPCSSASLYDPTDDEWMFESHGKLEGACVCAAMIWDDYCLFSWLSSLFISVLFLLSFSTSEVANSFYMFLNLFALRSTDLSLSHSSWEVTLIVGQTCMLF